MTISLLKGSDMEFLQRATMYFAFLAHKPGAKEIPQL